MAAAFDVLFVTALLAPPAVLVLELLAVVLATRRHLARPLPQAHATVSR